MASASPSVAVGAGQVCPGVGILDAVADPGLVKRAVAADAAGLARQGRSCPAGRRIEQPRESSFQEKADLNVAYAVDDGVRLEGSPQRMLG